MAKEAAMGKPEERNDDREEREADAKSMYLVPLGPSTPMPLPQGLALAATKVRELRYRYGITHNPYWQENIVRVRLADQAYKDREAERKWMLIATWAPIVASVSSDVATLAIAAAMVVYRLT